MTKKNALVLTGTRPEAIKLAPLVLELQQSSFLNPVLCATGQHKEMLQSALDEFQIRPQIDLSVMRENQSLTELSGRLLLGLASVIQQTNPACILVQGDTTTALMGAISGFYAQIPVGHVEAGLRSGDLGAPFPEEFNRKAISLATQWHFAPTQRAAQNLYNEHVEMHRVFTTGNTVVDALQYMQARLRSTPPPLPSVVENILSAATPYVLITGHRRENFGQGMENICTAIELLAAEFSHFAFIYPVHLNPHVRKVVHARIANLPNVVLIEPCNYREFLRLLDNCYFVLSDSGGVQEEAPSFGKQVLCMRTVTERPEGVEAGFCTLVGAECADIVREARKLLRQKQNVLSLSNPYGDGKACSRIREILEKSLA